MFVLITITDMNYLENGHSTIAKWNRDKFWSDYLIEWGWIACELTGNRVPCSVGCEAHHIVSRQMTLRNKKARRYTEDNWRYFIAAVCRNHNDIADSPDCRRLLIERRRKKYGLAKMLEVFGELDKLMVTSLNLQGYLSEVTK